MVVNKALIFGITGQDGSFLADILKVKGYEVHGVVRSSASVTSRFIHCCNDKQVHQLIDELRPTEIYNLAGLTNTFNPYADIPKTIELNLTLPVNILSAIYNIDKTIKFFQASSVLMSGNADGSPTYPYGITKLAAHNFVKLYRDLGLFACAGIFYPHESERRGTGFLSKKVCSTIARIKLGSTEKLELGDLNQHRDWGYAKDYMEAVHLMMCTETPKDYVIGSGILTKTEDFVRYAFEYASLKFEDHVVQDTAQFRQKDFVIQQADIKEITADLNWTPTKTVHDIIQIMIDWELNNINK